MSKIHLLSPIALERAFARLLPEFEKLSGHKVISTYVTAGAVVDRVEKGEAVDVAIATAPHIQDLQRKGRIEAGSPVNIAKVGVGVFARETVGKPLRE